MANHSVWWRWRGKAPSAPAEVDTAMALAAAPVGPDVATARQAVALSHLLDAATLALAFLDEAKDRMGYGYSTADLLDGAMRDAEAALGRHVRPARAARADENRGTR